MTTLSLLQRAILINLRVNMLKKCARLDSEPIRNSFRESRRVFTRPLINSVIIYNLLANSRVKEFSYFKIGRFTFLLQLCIIYTN